MAILRVKLKDGLFIVIFLVEKVYFPKYDDNYISIMKGKDNYGNLLSFTLKEKEETPVFFDALSICKGPSLGTNFTIACPYTLLAHYSELDVVEKYGVSRWLIRVSVGLENISYLLNEFDVAFSLLEKK